MSAKAPEPENDKAIARSISFYPGSLFTRVDKFANSQDPKRSTSSVVCEAVAEYLAKNDPVLDDVTTATLAQVEAATVKDPALAEEILKFIRDRKRSRRSSR